MNSKSKKIRYIITVMALAGLIGNPMLEGATVVATTLPTESESSEESEAPLPEALEPEQDTEESEETKSEDTPDRSASAEEILPPASSASKPEEPTPPADVASPERSTAVAAPKMTGTMWGGVDFEWNATTGELTLFGGTITDPAALPTDRWLINHIKFEGPVTVGGSRSLAGLFQSMTNLTAIENLTYLNTSGVTDMSALFSATWALTNLDLSSFDTSAVTDMSGMFNGTSSLTSLDLSNFDTSSVTDMNMMFRGASRLTSLDLSTFKTSAVTDMGGMFWGMHNLTSLDLSNFNTSAVTGMWQMFANASSLTRLDLSNFDTASVTNMHSMFLGASRLASLDLSSFVITSGTPITAMFMHTGSLRELKLGTGISRLNGTNLPAIGTTSGEFTGFWQNIDTGSAEHPNGTNVLDSAGLMRDFNPSMADTFVWQRRVVPKVWGDVEYDYDETSKTLTLEGGMITDPSDFDAAIRSEVEHIVFRGDVNVGGAMSLGGMFANFTNLVDIQNLERLNTAGVTDMSVMFAGTSSLTSLDLSSFDTSSVTNMHGMFGVTAFKSLDLSSFETSSVEDMSFMFYEARNLNSLDLSSFVTSSVEDMSLMFAMTESLTDINLSSFDTSSVRNMEGMFAGAESLTDIDLSSFVTSSVTNMSSMFARAALKSLDLTSFDTSSVTNMTSMFAWAESLISLNLSSFDIASSTDIRDMFFDTSSLRELKLGSGISRLNETRLPNISYASGEFTGLWQNVGTGSPERPNGTNVLTSDGLMQNFNPSMADTFVWQRTLPKVWGDVAFDYDETSKTLTLEGGTITNPSDFDSAIRTEVEHIVFQGDVNVGGSKSLSTLFDGFQNLRDIQNLEKLDTSGVTDMSWMFTGTSSLTSLDLSSFDTSAVTNMFAMFDSAESLTSLNLSSFDTSAVINMQSMFSDARSLSSLDLSSFETSSVTTMQGMFSDTSSLTHLDLSSFETGSVINMSWMFSGASSLTHLDLSSFETSSVTTMQDMFTGASNLARLDLSSFDTSAVDDAQFRLNFGGLNALVELRLGDNTAINLSNLPEFTTSTGYLNWWAREGEANNWLDSHQLMDLSATSGQAAGTWRRVPYQTKVQVKDSTLAVGDTWQAKDNFVQAINREGDEVPFEDVTVTGKVDTTKAGIYEVTYAYDGVSATAKVTVKAEEENGNGNGNNNSGENENGQDKDDSTSNNENSEDKVSDSDDTRGDKKQSQQEEPDLNAASRDKLPETGEIAGMLSWLGLGSLAVAMLLWYKRRRKK
ncbi:BspA family leucine-rich repeat surface protein [Lactococcus garvieae]|uniref:BspA family leucine-rich repeat surface protein n=1 Tax=Lactococcus garvieae TaxID=1363 RepID=UPI0018D8C062|nr:BspA family leucine-rich repeat surface protein [Lactococcus garvieae]QPS70306.1 BspA family leucine-rich repeat surface protein [Lactococcus garvieae]